MWSFFVCGKYTSIQIRNLAPYLLNNYLHYYSEYSQTQKITIIKKYTEYH